MDPDLEFQKEFAPSDTSLIVADAHVHIYDCYDLRDFFDRALKNLKTAFRKGAIRTGFTGLLFLTDTGNPSWFERLSVMARGEKDSGTAGMGNWALHPTREDESLFVGQKPGEGFFIIAGRQIRTVENLELLALATRETFQEGLSIEELILTVSRRGGIPVIPWAFGKWWGQRGKTIRALLKKGGSPGLFLGDNRNRLIGWPRSPLFREAEKQGIPTLPGSDPLPYPDEVSYPGSFGFMIRGSVSPDFPARDIKRILGDLKTSPTPFGSSDSPIHFFLNQLRLRLAAS